MPLPNLVDSSWKKSAPAMRAPQWKINSQNAPQGDAPQTVENPLIAEIMRDSPHGYAVFMHLSFIIFESMFLYVVLMKGVILFVRSRVATIVGRQCPSRQGMLFLQ
jgi:hypothetical protein